MVLVQFIQEEQAFLLAALHWQSFKHQIKSQRPVPQTEVWRLAFHFFRCSSDRLHVLFQTCNFQQEIFQMSSPTTIHIQIGSLQLNYFPCHFLWVFLLVLSTNIKVICCWAHAKISPFNAWPNSNCKIVALEINNQIKSDWMIEE